MNKLPQLRHIEYFILLKAINASKSTNELMKLLVLNGIDIQYTNLTNNIIRKLEFNNLLTSFKIGKQRFYKTSKLGIKELKVVDIFYKNLNNHV